VIADHDLSLGECPGPFAYTLGRDLSLSSNAISVYIFLMEGYAVMVHHVTYEYDLVTSPGIVEILAESPISWMACWLMYIPDN